MLTSDLTPNLEPVIYVNNCPFVLRESDFPLRNMAIYSGVASSSLENMESRLKVWIY
jgi:hypothetical protein